MTRAVIALPEPSCIDMFCGCLGNSAQFAHQREHDAGLKQLTAAINSFVAWADEDFEGLREVQKLSLAELRIRMEVDGHLGKDVLAAAGDDRLQLLHLLRTRCFDQPWLKSLRAQGQSFQPVLEASSSRTSLQRQKKRQRYQKWLNSLIHTKHFERLWMEIEAHELCQGPNATGIMPGQRGNHKPSRHHAWLSSQLLKPCCCRDR